MDNTRESLGKILYPALLVVVFGLVLVFTVRGPVTEPSDYAEVADATGPDQTTDQAVTATVSNGGATDVAVAIQSAAATVLSGQESIHTADTATSRDTPGESGADPVKTADATPDSGPSPGTAAEPGATVAATTDSGAGTNALVPSERIAQQPPVPTARPVPVTAVALTPPAPAPLPEVHAKEDKPEHVAVAADPIPNIGGPVAEDLMAGGMDGGPVQVHEHTVRLGETLTDIARAYNIDIDTILAANHIPDPNRIRSGDKLSVPNVKGVIHEVKRGESLWHIANNYDVTVDDIVAANEIANPNALRVGQSLVIPGAQAIISNSLRESLVSANGSLLRNFSWPVTGRISSPFGMRTTGMHYGLDIAVVTGTPVRAAAAGKVIYAADAGSYGLLVKIDHGNGIETRYAHNSRLVAKNGQRVARGEIVAYSGNTGRSTGPHVHFEIRRNGGALDPLDFLR